MERQYLIFIAAAAAGFAALVIVGLFFNPLQAAEDPAVSNFIEAEMGKTAYVRYTGRVIGLVQGLPDKNVLRIEAPSELLSTNLGGLKGEFRYTGMTIGYVQNGEQKEVDEKDFKTIQHSFFPDAGNMTSYTYRNVDFTAHATSAELIASFIPLDTARVGDEYPVKIILEGGPVDIGVGEKVIKLVE